MNKHPMLPDFYLQDLKTGIWSRKDFAGIAYNDGDVAEHRIKEILENSSDISLHSSELLEKCNDWTSRYHLSAIRSNAVRPFDHIIRNSTILEIGSGCGAITRHLGELGGAILAIEGSRRRAEITRIRTRDLSNVHVVCENFSQFKTNQKFDIVTLIGVLEYADVFMEEANAAQKMIEKIRELLTPDGLVLIAIENKLGLKYFSGAPEDHYMEPMIGVEGRYAINGAKTYGRHELNTLLTNAGLNKCSFLAPFPDYKFPKSIITEAGFLDGEFDPEPLIFNSVRSDSQLGENLSFSPEFVWGNIISNKISLDLSNSFIVAAQANKHPQLLEEEKTLGYHYSTARKIEYCKETSFTKKPNGIEVNTRLIFGEPSRAEVKTSGLLSHRVKQKSNYINGRPLFSKLAEILKRNHWTYTQVGEFYNEYIQAIKFTLRQEDTDISIFKTCLHQRLPSHFIDAIPHNILVAYDGSYHLIDAEWQTKTPVTLGQLIFRSVLATFNCIGRIGLNASHQSITPIKFLHHIYRELNIEAIEFDINRYIAHELEFQQEVNGVNLLGPDPLGINRVIPSKNIFQKFNELEAQAQNADIALSHMQTLLNKANSIVDERATKILALSAVANARGQEIEELQKVIDALEINNNSTHKKLGEALETATARLHLINEQAALIAHQNEQLIELSAYAHSLEITISKIRKSSSWIITYPFRLISILLRFDANQLKLQIQRARDIFAKAKKRVQKKISPGSDSDDARVQADITNVQSKVKDAITQENPQSACLSDIESDIFAKHPTHAKSWIILTTEHCLFMANLIQSQLERYAIESQIIHKKPLGGYDEKLHIVICPQMFEDLPSTYIAYQMEQSVNSRWFTEDYFDKLKNAYAIFDYSLKNVEYLENNGISHKHIYYMPISLRRNIPITKHSEEYDVLFYGDIQNGRRKRYLEQISARFKTKVISNLFGDELTQEIKKAKVVINIHYYDNALLETTRIYECLSQGAIVISEESSDISEHKNTLGNIIDFVPINDIDAMIKMIDARIKDPVFQDIRRRTIRELSITGTNDFEFYFSRFLLANDIISYDEFYSHAAENIQLTRDFLCLGLPETIERKKSFDADNRFGIQYCPGLRHNIGWIGCGLSYKFLLQRARDQGLDHIVICEDDVLFPDDFEVIYNAIKSFISEKSSWDIYSGLLANLHSDTKIISIESKGSDVYIQIDKIISMVFNIYNTRVFDVFAKWNENNRDPATNTIDRFIENHRDLTIFTSPVFLVGHKEELHSTLWGFNNKSYKRMISESQRLLGQKLIEYSLNS